MLQVALGRTLGQGTLGVTISTPKSNNPRHAAGGPGLHAGAGHVWRDDITPQNLTTPDMLQVALGRTLGQGTFGVTRLGAWRGGDVAVKAVRVGAPSEATSFLREVAALAAIRHPNVLGFYGELSGCPHLFANISRPAVIKVDWQCVL